MRRKDKQSGMKNFVVIIIHWECGCDVINFKVFFNKEEKTLQKDNRDRESEKEFQCLDWIGTHCIDFRFQQEKGVK